MVPQNGWFELENPIKMDDLGGPPLFLETPIFLFSASYIRDIKTGPLSPGLLMGDPRISTVLFLHVGHGAQGDADHARLSLNEIGFLDNWEAG